MTPAERARAAERHTQGVYTVRGVDADAVLGALCPTDRPAVQSAGVGAPAASPTRLSANSALYASSRAPSLIESATRERAPGRWAACIEERPRANARLVTGRLVSRSGPARTRAWSLGRLDPGLRRLDGPLPVVEQHQRVVDVPARCPRSANRIVDHLARLDVALHRQPARCRRRRTRRVAAAAVVERCQSRCPLSSAWWMVQPVYIDSGMFWSWRSRRRRSDTAPNSPFGDASPG